MAAFLHGDAPAVIHLTDRSITINQYGCNLYCDNNSLISQVPERITRQLVDLANLTVERSRVPNLMTITSTLPGNASMNADYVMVREQLMAILLELDRLDEPVAAVYVNQALEFILAKVPL